MSSKNLFPETVIGLDVETTSLDPKEGDIIEIAAIRYDLTKPKGRPKSGPRGTYQNIGVEVAEFNKLAKPTNKLSDQITAITGITNEMVKDQPVFSDYVEELQSFIGNDIVFAHNATFDINFLTHHGITFNAPAWDTFVLAGIAWPEAPSYNLGTLASQLDIKVVGEHRAGDDVRLTWELLNKVRQELSLREDYYKYVTSLLDSSNQEFYSCFFESRKEIRKKSEKGSIKEMSTEKSIGSSNEILGPKGVLESTLEGFSYRQEQLEMAETIEKYIEDHKAGFIEAGTGTGKTYAYLVPLIKAATTKPPSIISTHTKNLQDQLSKHDLPRLLEALDVDLKTALLKGRRNYLCLTRLLQSLSRVNHKPDEALLLIKLLNWLDKGGNGDLELFNTSHQGAHLLHHLHADALSCRLTCPTDQPDCPYQVAKKKAQEADIVVVNHALLTQLVTEDGSLPVTNIVIDEAHHLEDVARDATKRDLSEHRVAEIVAPFVQLGRGKDNHQRIRDEAQDVLVDYQHLMAELMSYTREVAAGDQIRLTPAVRKSSRWKKIAATATTWQGRLQFLVGLVQGTSFTPKQQKVMHEASSDAGIFSRYFKEFIEGNAERIQWIEYQEAYFNNHEPKLHLHDAALSVTGQLSPLYRQAHSITLTSATLTTGASFSFVKERLGLSESEEKKLGSPFDYKKQMLIYIVDDSAHPASQDFNDTTAKHLTDISKLISGRLLGLFTSHQAVKDVYYKSIKQLNKANIKLLAQKMSGGRHNIIARFKKNPDTVLIGTYSFWEGVDVPGDNLSAVLIPKLPFAPPNDPVVDAVAESEQSSSFMNFSLPHMILRLRQGVGRLIRSVDDRGVVVILDSRFLHKEYGKNVLDSFPPATVHIGSSHDLISKITDWFGEEKISEWQARSD